MSIQHWCKHLTVNPGTGATNFTIPFHSSASNGTEAEETVECPIATTISQLQVVVGAAPGVGKSWTITLRKNGGDQTLTCTISDNATSASDTSNSVSVAVGDTLTMKVVPSGTPTASGGMWMSMQSDGSVSGESAYGFYRSNISTSAVRYNACFFGQDWMTAVPSQLVAAAGTITHMRFTVTTAPTSGKSYTFYIYKNGVKQDGTGGTVDTLVTIADAATSGNASFSLAVVAGDEVYIECTPINTPAGAPQCRGALAFTATTPGESQFSGVTVNTGPSVTLTNYIYPNYLGPSVTHWNSTEASRQAYASPQGFTLSKLRVKLTTAPGSGNSYAFTVRKNAAGGGLGVTISDAATTGNDLSNFVAFSGTDRLSFESVPTSNPTATGIMTWALVQTDGTSDPGATGQPTAKRQWGLPYGASHGRQPGASNWGT
jgi:hypothetical protein